MSPRRPISNHRIARVSTWALLWLKWLVAFLDVMCCEGPLSRQVERAASVWLKPVSQWLVATIIIRATPRFRRRIVIGGGPRVKRACSLRAIIGCALWRKLHHRRNVRARIATLIDLLRDPEPAIAALLQRLPRGLTRLRRPPPVQRLLTLTSAATPCACVCADTS